jgi:predicted DCC family thiol-disulfide oxidoreductase YuxK
MIEKFRPMNSELTEKTDIRESARSEPISKAAEDSRSYGLNCHIPHQPKRWSVRHRPRTSRGRSFRGRILYDGACPSCFAWAKGSAKVFRRRGFLFLPLQTERLMHQLGLEPDAPLEEMHVLTSEGRDIAGAKAVIFLARQIWWAWPCAGFARLPGIRSLLNRGYRWIAAHRGCDHVTCAVNERQLPSRQFRRTAGSSRIGDWRQPLLEVLPAWTALITLPSAALLVRDHLAPWQFTWLMAAAIFFGCKWLTAWRALQRNADPTLPRTLGYFFAWPGMDAERFLAPTPSRPLLDRLKPLSLVLSRTQARPAIANILLGAVLFFGFARFPQQQLLAGWIGMIGMILILHFGLFRLVAAGWHKVGINVEPIMNAPLRSKTVSEFWGRRWNTAFNRLAVELVFRLTVRGLGGRSSCDTARRSRRSSTLHLSQTTMIATLTAFLVSGLIHELVISLPAGAGYGLPTVYFLLQGIGILVEKASPQIRGRIFTVLIIALPAFCLFHPPFVRNVILPFMKAIRAL